MPKKVSPLQPNATVVALLGLLMAIVLGVSNSSWAAGTGFGIFGLAVAGTLNWVLVNRRRRQLGEE